MSIRLDPSLRHVLDRAESAVQFARDTRRMYARRKPKGNRQREHDINTALRRLKHAMKPLRSEIAHIPFLPRGEASIARAQAVRAASAAIQRERRKLWKMQDPKLRAKRRQPRQRG